LKQKFSQNRIDSLLKEVGPVTHFEELAQDGHLLEYLNEFVQQRYQSDNRFRGDMFKLLYRYSQTPVEELDLYYLNHLSRTLEKFSLSTKHNG
jgi:hypothetical protein